MFETMYHGGVTVHFLTARGFTREQGLGVISTGILLSFHSPKKQALMRNPWGFNESVPPVRQTGDQCLISANSLGTRILEQTAMKL